MKNLFIIIFLLRIFASITYSQNAKLPYPIIFIHGITADYTTWEDGEPSIKSYLQSQGLIFGGVIDVTLDYLRDVNSLRNSIDQDVHRFTENIDIMNGDFFFLNFAVHSSGYSTKNDTNYPYPTNQTYQDMLDVGNLPVITTPGEYHIGDIIRVDNEFMLVTYISSDFLGVTRGILNSTPIAHFSASRVFNLSNESNQSSIAKQGWGVKLAIELIKDKTGADKVIIVGHSMGGLSAREYIRSSYYQNDVAKLITIGTPHLGAKSDNLNVWWFGNNKLDDRSDAMRDLRYQYSNDIINSYSPDPPYGDFPDDGVYLFGGWETQQLTGYYSTDFNSNGIIDTYEINGLSKNLNTLLNTVDYTWIVSSVGELGDEAVRWDRQLPWDETGTIGDTILIHKLHHNETKDVHNIIRGMDEPDIYQLAYNIEINSTYSGYITHQTNYNPTDYDYFKIISTGDGTLDLEINGSNSGVNGIVFRDQSGTLIRSESISTFPFTFQENIEAGLYFIGITGSAYASQSLNSYTLLPTFEPLIISLYNGSITPVNGDETTNFNFSVYYKNTNGVAPDNVQLHIINEFTENMTAGGSNWQQGVQFTKTLNNFAVGQYQFYFSATINGQTLRFPDSGYLDFNVTQNVAGWDLGVVPEGSYLQPSSIGPGTTINVGCDIFNYSNSGNIYTNVPLFVELRSPTGELLDQNSYTIPSLASNTGSLYTLDLNCPSNAINGNYSVAITIVPNVDSNPINNSHTLNFYIGPSIGTELYESEESEIFLYIDETFSACGYTFKLAGVSGGNQATIQEPSGTLRTINTEHIRLFTSYDCAIAVASVGSNYASIRVLCAISSGGPSFSNKEIIGYPGQQNIYFDVEAPTGRTFLSTTSDYGDIYTTGISTNLPRDWFDGINLYNSAHNVKIRFDIPTSATLGTYVFYQPTPYVGSSVLDHYTKVQIKIIAQPPIVNSLSSYAFSADDQITITGTGFGTPGSIKFNSLTVSEFVSWTTTQIKVMVPVGVQSGNLFVLNSNGLSNGKAYTIISSTGEPIVVAPIPDQSIYQAETKFIASLNNVFSDPNNQVLTFSATSSNPEVLINQGLLSGGELHLIASEYATGTSNIFVIATDPNSKTATDQFVVTILTNQQSFITLTSPNGGENWVVGSQRAITWASNATSGNVKIEITRDGESSWEVLYANTLDDGTEIWNVTTPVTNTAKIRISEISGNLSDKSDNTFNIYAQNVPPTLTWTGEPGYETDGVNPNEGSAATTFTFRVKYADADGDAPLTGYPKIHVKKGGVEINNSPFTMTEVLVARPTNSKGNGKDEDVEIKNKSKTESENSMRNPMIDGFLEGVIYEYSTSLEAGTDYSYFFEARDVNNNIATGVPTFEQSGPIVNSLITAITLTQPFSNVATIQGDSVIIKWYLTNPTTGTVNLFADMDSIWANGNEIPIAFFIPIEDSSTWWHTEGVTPGKYYIVGYLTDGQGNPYDYADGTVTIYIEPFTETSIVLPSVYAGSVCWVDYDNDNDLDIFLSGNGISKIYKNGGNDTFTEQTSIYLYGAYNSSSDWGDYDNDGDMDLLVVGGSSANGYQSIIYKNNGNDNFTDINAGLVVLGYGAARWVDFDNDGDLDITLTGHNTGVYPITKLYRNDGGDVFTLIISPNVTNVMGSSCDWGDYDNDKDLDLLLSGRISGSEIVTFIHRNDGGGNFTKMDTIDLYGGWNGSVEWGDYNSDGYLDIIFTGSNTTGSPQTRIYRNDSNDMFVDVTPPTIPQLSDSDTDWGDYDNDGDLDFIITGWEGNSEITSLFRNDGNDNFTEVTDALFYNLRYSSSDWGDYDNDGDLDLLLSGYTSSTAYSKVYRNNSSIVNSIPATPNSLSYNIVNGNEVELSWSKIQNDETPPNGLSYNLRVGTTSGGCEIISPMSNPITGKRRIVNLGNTNHNNSWTIKGLSPGTYYWSVQAIDNNFAGSQFATEQSFTITPPITNHFAKVWSGNPYLAMNIYVTSAKLDEIDLGPGDEIGIFDGDVCVGSGILTESIPVGGFLAIIASTDDPATPAIDGFTVGHTISYRYWDFDNAIEINLVTPAYSAGNGTFASLGTSVVDLVGRTAITQIVNLISGWSIFSLSVIPENPNMLSLLNPLITAGVLVKVQDEQGNAVEQLPPPIGWINSIGNWQPTESYYARLNAPATLSVTGQPIPLPLSIPLINGWNIISYPCEMPQNALTVLDPLILAGTLVKVQDEQGNAVEQLPPPIGWINNIGDFEIGEGYYLRANAITSITIDCPTTLAKGNQSAAGNSSPEYFDLSYAGNPYQPMNVYIDIVGIEGIKAGDEIAIYDGKLCVGAVIVSEESIESYISVIASMDDPFTKDADGFKEGNQLELVLWDGSKEEKLMTKVITENKTKIFKPRGTILVKLISIGEEKEQVPTEYILRHNYPNPFNPFTIIEYGIPEDSDVRLIVYNLLGEEIMTLVNEKQVPGMYRVKMDASNLPSGVYLYMIIANDFVETKKLMLLK